MSIFKYWAAIPLSLFTTAVLVGTASAGGASDLGTPKVSVGGESNSTENNNITQGQSANSFSETSANPSALATNVAVQNVFGGGDPMRNVTGYDFADCASAEWVAGTTVNRYTSDYSSSFGSTSYGLFTGIRVPLGGRSGRACADQAENIANSTLADFCIALMQNGVEIVEGGHFEAYRKICSGLAFAPQPAPEPEVVIRYVEVEPEPQPEPEPVYIDTVRGGL